MQIGDKLPEFNLQCVDGNMYNQFMYADKYALAIVFTCNSSEASKSYGQRLIKLLKQYEEDNLGIIGINSNDASQSPDDSLEQMKIISDKLHLEDIRFRYLIDANQEIAKKFGATINPEVFLFNSKRELVYKGAIDDCWENEHMVTQAWLEDAIENALDGIEVDFPEVEPMGTPIIWKK
ncbi:MAG: redoxin domain-containing protein [Bacteroidetes bacterium]|nr:redoxin domain-containing protein [Bacteroidota bacterium]